MTKIMKTSLIRLCVALASMAVFGQAVFAAVTFTVTPVAVSNTYTGTISLQIGGLTNTEKVVVQKFLDLNTNGVIDGGDVLVQQFTLQDGTNFVIGGVTNFNVPGDLNATTGAITATLNFQNGDFVQNIVGNYLYVLSSPGGHFTPLTSQFAVTNFPFLQMFTGNVVSNSTSTMVSNAVVLLFPPPSPGGSGPGGSPLAGVVANNAGSYTVQVPPGTYQLLAFRSNFVANMNTAPVLTLAASQTITTNLTLTNATGSISGTNVDDSNSSIRLPGEMIPVTSTNGLIAITFADTNGIFSVPVTASKWRIKVEDTTLIVHGYLGLQNGTNVNSGTTGLSLAVPKATALIYGSVKDNLGNPLVGLDVYASDNNNLYETDGYTDANGNYVLGVLGLGTSDSWWMQANGNDQLTNYVFSQETINGNINAGQAVLQNFTAILATNHITGTVKNSSNNPIVGVGVNANATINGTNYQAYVDTDANGNYSMNVANGNWNIGVNCNGGDDSLQNLGNYQCPNNQTITITNNNGLANFTVQTNINVGGPLQVTTVALPSGVVGVAYDQQLTADGGNPSPSYIWLVYSGSLPEGLSMDSGGTIQGTPTSSGTNFFTVQVSDNNGHTATQALSLTIIGVLQVTTTSLSSGTTNVPYNSQQLTASGGQPPYGWSLASGRLPPGLGLSASGVISGTPTTAGTSNFVVQVTDSLSATATQALSLVVYTFSTSVTFAVTPPAVSNLYTGTITLQAGGLASSETVIVQKYLDLNTNGVIDGTDWLVQQFQLTDGQSGMVIGGIVNSNVPGDTDTTAGQITAKVNFHNGDFIQNIAGKYLYKLFSPAGHFAPITNQFAVTNFPFLQMFTGNVVSNGTSTTVPNAVVILFSTLEPGGKGLNYPQAGAVANNSGNYTIPVPAGNYMPMAFKCNFLVNFTMASFLTLSSGQTLTTNLTVTNATSSISGQVVDANNSNLGVPGTSLAAVSANGLMGFARTDTNGNFSVGVQSGQWGVKIDDYSLMVQGYVGLQNGSNINSGTTGNNLGYPKATALFYGSVKDNLGNPLAGIDIYAHDYSSNLYETDGDTDANGNYFVAVVGGLGTNDLWSLETDSSHSMLTNYVFSQPAFLQDGGTNMSIGQAVRADITALPANNHISGSLKDNSGNPIVGVNIWANETINGVDYNNISIGTDANGNYSLNVANGTWTVGVNNSPSVGSSLPDTYLEPAYQMVEIANNNGLANFTAQTNINVDGPLQVTTAALPNGAVGAAYDQQLTADGGQPNPSYNWSVISGSLPPELSMDSGGTIQGTPASGGTSYFTVQVNDNNGSTATQALSLTIASPLDVLAYCIVKMESFLQTNAANIIPDTSRGPFSATLAIFQSSLNTVPIANVDLPSRVVKGFPPGSSGILLESQDLYSNQAALDGVYTNGNYTFALATLHDGFKFPVLAMPVVVYPAAPCVSNFAAAQAINPLNPFTLQWSNPSDATTNDTLWVYIADTNGTTVFSTPRPATNLSSCLRGTATSVVIPTNTIPLGKTYTGVITFYRLVGSNSTDYPGANGLVLVSARTRFSLVAPSAAPVLSQPAKLSGTQFGFQLSGIAGQNYTVQYSTTLTNWNTLYVTNAPANSFLLIDFTATNAQRFYRVLVGP
jgi:hypothetical protein